MACILHHAHSQSPAVPADWPWCWLEGQKSLIVCFLRCWKAFRELGELGSSGRKDRSARYNLPNYVWPIIYRCRDILGKLPWLIKTVMKNLLKCLKLNDHFLLYHEHFIGIMNTLTLNTCTCTVHVFSYEELSNADNIPIISPVSCTVCAHVLCRVWGL